MNPKHYPISNYIVKNLITSGAIKPDQFNLYLYLANELLECTFNILSVLVISALFFKLIWGIIFLILIVPLRSYAGGYHAPSSISCYIASLCMYIIAMLCCTHFDYFHTMLFPIIPLGISLVILLLAPVKVKNKPLTDIKHKKNKIITLFICLIINIFYNISYFINIFPHYQLLCVIILLYTISLQTIQCFININDRWENNKYE